MVNTYVDNDISAYRGARRPQYERMLQAVRDGEVTTVIAWHPDRLYRHPRDLEAFVETIEAVRASAAGALQSSDSFPQSSYVRWTTQQYSSAELLASQRLYHTIPASGEGSSGTHYDQTSYGYDLIQRQNRVVMAGGTISTSRTSDRSTTKRSGPSRNPMPTHSSALTSSPRMPAAATLLRRSSSRSSS